jgi:hypothetical protein
VLIPDVAFAPPLSGLALLAVTVGLLPAVLTPQPALQAQEVPA